MSRRTRSKSGKRSLEEVNTTSNNNSLTKSLNKSGSKQSKRKRVENSTHEECTKDSENSSSINTIPETILSETGNKSTSSTSDSNNNATVDTNQQIDMTETVVTPIDTAKLRVAEVLKDSRVNISNNDTDGEELQIHAIDEDSFEEDMRVVKLRGKI